MDRRDFFKAAAGMVLVGGTGIGSSVRAQTSGRNFVLVAGAFAGGWVWTRVAQRLRSQGHRVFTPSLTGLGDRAHLLSSTVNLDTFIQDMIGVIESEELSNVILVGSSFGGVTISGVADRMPERIRHLVYLDAVIVEPGKSFLDGLPPPAAANLRKIAQDTSGGLSLPLPPAANIRALGVSEPDVTWLLRRYTPQPFASFDTPLKVQNPIGNGLPRTYIACLKPDFAAIGPSRAWVRQQTGWNWIEMQTGHLPMVAAPDELTDTFIRIAA